jgi:C4-dicarboxylate transporter DctQ subunit
MLMLLGWLRKIEGNFLSLLMIVMALLYAFNIAVRELATRYAARFDWIEEATLFALAWIVFLGLGLTLDAGRHIAMTALFKRLPAHLRKLLGKLIDFTGLCFCLYIAWVGYSITVFVAKSGQISTSLGISMAWLYAPMPVGFALLALRYLVDFLGITDRYRDAQRGQEQ